MCSVQWTHLSSSNCGQTVPVIMIVVTGHWNVWFIAKSLCDGWYPCHHHHHHHHHYLRFINKVKRWNNSPKVTCLVSGRIRIWTQQCGSRVQGLDLIQHCLSLKDRTKKCYGITQPGRTHLELRDERWLPEEMPLELSFEDGGFGQQSWKIEKENLVGLSCSSGILLGPGYRAVLALAHASQPWGPRQASRDQVGPAPVHPARQFFSSGELALTIWNAGLSSTASRVPVLVSWVAMAFWCPNMARKPLSAQIFFYCGKKAHEIYFLNQLLSVQYKCYNRKRTSATLIQLSYQGRKWGMN